MARKTSIITIDNDDRDAGKKFEITEMSAEQAEAWAERALGAIGRSNLDIPEDVLTRGLAGIVIVGLKTFASIPWAELKPLLDEMFQCIALIPPASPNLRIKEPVLSTQIEEVKTRILLRDAVLELHLGFSIAGELSKLRAASLARLQDSQNTPTSQEGSE